MDYLRHDGYFATRLADGQLALSEIRYAPPDLLKLLDSAPQAQASGPAPQSTEAAGKALELHAGESRMKAIQGSAGTQDRRNQGKRDHRGE